MDVLRRTAAMVSLPNISETAGRPQLGDGAVAPITRSRSDQDMAGPALWELTDAQKKGVELGLRLSTSLRTIHEGRTVTDRFRDAETMLLGADAEHDELAELGTPRSGMSRSLSGLSISQLQKTRSGGGTSLCKKSLRHTIEEQPTDYKCRFHTQYTASYVGYIYIYTYTFGIHS